MNPLWIPAGMAIYLVTQAINRWIVRQEWTRFRNVARALHLATIDGQLRWPLGERRET